MVRIVIHFIAIVKGNQRKIFALRMSFVCNARRIDTDGKGMVLASLLSIFAILLLLFLFPNFFVGGVAVFESQKIWGLV